MAAIIELGYVGLSVSDAGAWKKFATELLGLQVVEEGDSHLFYLRMDRWHHRFLVHVDGGDDLAYVGWRVDNQEDMLAVGERLSSIGVGVSEPSREEARERRVLGFLRCQSPGGITTEVFYGPEIDQRPFLPGRPMYGSFKVGDDLGLGHIFLREEDVPAATRFYKDGLGMKGGIEYCMPSPAGVLELPFFYCNQRQHSAAFGLPGLPFKLQHVMVECTSLDDVGRAYDVCKREGYPITMELGKHSNDHLTSFYVRNPSGWDFEYGWGARPQTGRAEYFASDIWGHAMTDDYVVKEAAFENVSKG